MKKFFSLALITFMFYRCSHKIPLHVNFYDEKKIGVVIIVDSISRFKFGSQGKLDKSLSSGAKYKQALKSIGKKINPKPKFLEITKRKLTEKNKPFIIISDNLNFKTFESYKKSDTINKFKYYTKDVRSLKSKYDIEQLMLVKVKYGLSINYYSMIETSKGGLTTIDVDIINLNDNTIIYKDLIKVYEIFNGKWNTPPIYKELDDNINKSLSTAYKYYESKF